MGIFGGSTNAFDPMIEKVTDEKNTNEDWGEIMTVCDRVGATTSGPKECLKALVRRLNNPDPHVVLQAITVLDACVNNCGRNFLLEVASRDFETEFRKLLSKSHPKVVEKLKLMLKKWVEGEFSKDAAYSLIPALYASLRREGMDFSSEEDRVKKTKVPADPLAVASQQEEDDIAKAIALSLKETKGSGSGSGGSKASAATVLYPTESLYSGAAAAAAASPAAPAARKEEEKKARALYDFEAAEDNELTFKAGEIVIILDDADPNWWKGSNHRGEGLFPSNFVSMDMTEPGPGAGERKRSVVFNEEVEVKEVEQVTWPQQNTIDEEKINSVLALLHDADPTTGEHDPPDLARLEDQVTSMGPIIDTELERVDRRHAQLTRLSHQLVDALTLYHTLMRDMPPAPAYGGPMYAPQPGPGMYMAAPGPGMMPGPGPQMAMAGPPMSMGPGGPMPMSSNGMTMAPPPGPGPVYSQQPPMGGGDQQQQQQPGMTSTPSSMAGGSMPAHNMSGGGMPAHNMAPGPQQPGPGQQMYMDPYMYPAPAPGPAPGYAMMPGSAPPPTPPLQDHQLSVHTSGQQQQQQI